MFEQLVILFLIGLGVKTPTMPGNVLGDKTEVAVSATQKNSGESQGNTQTSTKNIRVQDFVAERKRIENNFFEDMKNRRASAAAAFKKERDAFKARLATIKDTAKRTKLENVNEVISHVNTIRVQAMTNKLNTMDQILARITSGLATLSEGGVDTTTAQNAVNAAMTAISSAKSAVAIQAAKEYIIGITSESNLGNDVGRARTELANDLKSVEALITQARQAITTAIKAYATLKGELTQ